MKIVIDVSDTLYKTCKRLVSEGDPRPSESCIANGIPLPKGHGRLKDIDTVERLLDLDKPDNVIAKALKTIIESVPTIIEADESEAEE